MRVSSKVLSKHCCILVLSTSFLLKNTASWLISTHKNQYHCISNVGKDNFMAKVIIRNVALKGLQNDDDETNIDNNQISNTSYNLGIGKNMPLEQLRKDKEDQNVKNISSTSTDVNFWSVPKPVKKPIGTKTIRITKPLSSSSSSSSDNEVRKPMVQSPRITRRMVA